jgi:hypothetical protein
VLLGAAPVLNSKGSRLLLMLLQLAPAAAAHAFIVAQAGGGCCGAGTEARAGTPWS